MLSYSSEENGVTTLRFYRKRNTTDQQNDVAIQVKLVVAKLPPGISDYGWFCVLKERKSAVNVRLTTYNISKDGKQKPVVNQSTEAILS